MGFVHALITLVALPYALLATAFLMVGEVARSRGMFEVIKTLFSYVDGFARWGIYLVPLACFLLAIIGFVPGLRRAGAVCVVGLAAASLVTICLLSSTKLGLGELTFLVPLVAVIVVGCWLFVAAGRVASAPL